MYAIQRCSYCKHIIFHPDDRTKVRRRNECLCSNRGDYFIRRTVISDSSGICRNMDEDDYVRTKLDQEHETA